MSNLTKDFNANRPFGGTHEQAEHGWSGLFNPNVDGLGGSALIEALMITAGINVIIQVNDCEGSGDWTESDDTTFDYAVGALANRS